MKFPKKVLDTIDKYSKTPTGCGGIACETGLCPLYVYSNDHSSFNTGNCFIQEEFENELKRVSGTSRNVTYLGDNSDIEHHIHLVCKNIMKQMKIQEILK